MDPVTIKFAQRIFAEILGAIVLLGGIYLFIKGVSGRSTIIVEGHGVKAKFINASPGLVTSVIGLVILFLSLNSVVEEHTHSQLIDEHAVINAWLTRSYAVTGVESYSARVDTIVGRGTGTIFISKEKRVDRITSLGDIAMEEYGNRSYWHILAAINCDRGYFQYIVASDTTTIPTGRVVEIWKVSKYSGLDTVMTVNVRGRDRATVWAELLSQVERGKKFGRDISFESLSDEMKPREVNLALTYVRIRPEDSLTLRDLSLEYYKDKRFWKLILWTNEDILPPGLNANTLLHTDDELQILTTVP